MSVELKNAIADRRAAEQLVANTLRSEYPPGRPIKWKWGDRVVHGVVVANRYGDRILVRNSETGRERDIYAYRIV